MLGLICTATLIFFLEPIERAAQRFSDAVMPNTRATPEYESYRKLQVYEAALQSALEQGGISDRERHMLNSPIQLLGIDTRAAAAPEQDALAGSRQHFVGEWFGVDLVVMPGRAVRATRFESALRSHCRQYQSPAGSRDR